ncbi:MAG: response regulator transcription factor [Acholeplasmatales bacterium]|nr:response regulator transcription factor [Acholeplasmatales bacterium]
MRMLIAHRSDEVIERFIAYSEQSFQIDYAKNGIDVLSLCKQNSYDVLVLEDNLPQIDGVSLISDIRKIKTNVYIAILSSKFDDFSIKFAYLHGANDYLGDTFNPEMIIMKFKNLSLLTQSSKLEVGEIMLDYEGRLLFVNGEKKVLTLKEFELLSYLIKHRGKAISREQIFMDVWDYKNASSDDRTIDTHIKMLRNELGQYKNYIETYRGFGYKFEVK